MGSFVKGHARKYQEVEGYPAKACTAATKAQQSGLTDHRIRTGEVEHRKLECEDKRHLYHGVVTTHRVSVILLQGQLPI
jgi:hypothetical protein